MIEYMELMIVDGEIVSELSRVAAEGWRFTAFIDHRTDIVGQRVLHRTLLWREKPITEDEHQAYFKAMEQAFAAINRKIPS